MSSQVATDGTRQAFVHISAFPQRSSRPVLGEALTFELEHSAQGKRRAARVHTQGHEAPLPVSAPRGSRRRLSPSYLMIVAFVIAYLVINAFWPVPYWVAGIYLVPSIACFIAYAADKGAARAGSWRVSENTLLFLGAVGGWPGAIVAQQTLRHKTKKESFRFAFWLTVAVNVIGFVLFTTPVLALLGDAAEHPLF